MNRKTMMSFLNQVKVNDLTHQFPLCLLMLEFYKTVQNFLAINKDVLYESHAKYFKILI